MPQFLHPLYTHMILAHFPQWNQPLDHFRLAARHEAEASVDALPPAKFREKTGKLISFSNLNWGLQLWPFTSYNWL